MFDCLKKVPHIFYSDTYYFPWDQQGKETKEQKPFISSLDLLTALMFRRAPEEFSRHERKMQKYINQRSQHLWAKRKMRLCFETVTTNNFYSNKSHLQIRLQLLRVIHLSILQRQNQLHYSELFWPFKSLWLLNAPQVEIVWRLSRMVRFCSIFNMIWSSGLAWGYNTWL